VRQLESMVRLAEARARCELSAQVKAKHVTEVASMLESSIHTVEKKPIELEEEEKEEEKEADEDQTMKTEESEQKDQKVAEEEKSEHEQTEETKDDRPDDEQKKKKNTISFQDYSRISNLLVRHIRKFQEQSMKQGDMVSWYCDLITKTGDIHSTLELAQAGRLMRSIIKRLFETDHILLLVEDNSDDKDKRLFEVNPNYDIESDVNAPQQDKT